MREVRSIHNCQRQQANCLADPACRRNCATRDVAGRATVQTVLDLSAQQAAGGPRQQGKQRAGDVVWYGQEAGSVTLSDRKLALKRAAPAPEGARR